MYIYIYIYQIQESEYSYQKNGKNPARRPARPGPQPCVRVNYRAMPRRRPGRRPTRPPPPARLGLLTKGGTRGKGPVEASQSRVHQTKKHEQGSCSCFLVWSGVHVPNQEARARILFMFLGLAWVVYLSLYIVAPPPTRPPPGPAPAARPFRAIPQRRHTGQRTR